jgi:hypothetical protein
MDVKVSAISGPLSCSDFVTVTCILTENLK